MKITSKLLTPVIEFHESELKSLRSVIDNDDNMFSEPQRTRARTQAAMHQDFLDRLKAMNPGSLPEFEHLKTGGVYSVYGLALVQSETPLHDETVVTIYRDVETGAWFVRTPREFEDGRFRSTALPPPPPKTIHVSPDDEIDVLLKSGDDDDRNRTMTRAQFHAIVETRSLLIDYETDPDDEDMWGDWHVFGVTNPRAVGVKPILWIRRV